MLSTYNLLFKSTKEYYVPWISTFLCSIDAELLLTIAWNWIHVGRKLLAIKPESSQWTLFCDSGEATPANKEDSVSGPERCWKEKWSCTQEAPSYKWVSLWEDLVLCRSPLKGATGKWFIKTNLILFSCPNWSIPDNMKYIDKIFLTKTDLH